MPRSMNCSVAMSMPAGWSSHAAEVTAPHAACLPLVRIYALWVSLLDPSTAMYYAGTFTTRRDVCAGGVLISPSLRQLSARRLRGHTGGATANDIENERLGGEKKLSPGRGP